MDDPHDGFFGGLPPEPRFGHPEELQEPDREPEINSWPWLVAAGAALAAVLIFLLVGPT